MLCFHTYVRKVDKIIIKPQQVKKPSCLICNMSLLMLSVKRELLNQIFPVVCPGPSTIHCFFNYSGDKVHLENL